LIKDRFNLNPCNLVGFKISQPRRNPNETVYQLEPFENFVNFELACNFIIDGVIPTFNIFATIYNIRLDYPISPMATAQSMIEVTDGHTFEPLQANFHFNIPLNHLRNGDPTNQFVGIELAWSIYTPEDPRIYDSLKNGVLFRTRTEVIDSNG